MVHSEHNKSRRGGGFALIIFGALLLFLAPNIHGEYPEMAIASLIGGFIIGAIGFYLNFVKRRREE
jgi:inner membrane protein involved in colicin E2 resistance